MFLFIYFILDTLYVHVRMCASKLIRDEGWPATTIMPDLLNRSAGTTHTHTHTGSPSKMLTRTDIPLNAMRPCQYVGVCV